MNVVDDNFDGPFTFLIADDHPLFREAVKVALRERWPGAHLLEVESFQSLETATAAHPEIDLVLLDLNMPGAQGFSSLIYLRTERPAVPVVIVSADDQPRTVRRAQQFGAAGFIAKSVRPDGMQAAIGQILEGNEWFPAVAAERSEDDARLAAQLAQLTPQQLRVLMCLAEGMLNKQIAHTLDVAENTVKVHVTAVLRKLECHTRTQAALLVKALEASGS
jgi:DNA-binding NarL/FixJ family response regulator